jgi:hypothetical protein
MSTSTLVLPPFVLGPMLAVAFFWLTILSKAWASWGIARVDLCSLGGRTRDSLQALPSAGMYHDETEVCIHSRHDVVKCASPAAEERRQARQVQESTWRDHQPTGEVGRRHHLRRVEYKHTCLVVSMSAGEVRKR